MLPKSNVGLAEVLQYEARSLEVPSIPTHTSSYTLQLCLHLTAFSYLKRGARNQIDNHDGLFRMSNMDEIKDRKDYSKVLMSDGIAVLEGTATWCSQCKAISPFIDKVSTPQFSPAKPGSQTPIDRRIDQTNPDTKTQPINQPTNQSI